MTKPPCPSCDYTHASDDARAIGIFQPGGPFGYTPSFDGTIYATREEAEQATCEHRINNCGTAGCEGWTNPTESETTE